MTIEDQNAGRSTDLTELAEITEEITRRLESGDPLSLDECVGTNTPRFGSIRHILPTLQTIVSIGELIAREQGIRDRRRIKTKKASS